MSPNPSTVAQQMEEEIEALQIGRATPLPPEQRGAARFPSRMERSAKYASEDAARIAGESPALPDGEVRIVDPETGAEKGQKLARYDLIPFDALHELAEVYGVGAAKYSDDNWRSGYRHRLSLGAMLRHVFAWARGQRLDPETGKHHLAHAAWHCFTLMTYETYGLGTDDVWEHHNLTEGS